MFDTEHQQEVVYLDPEDAVMLPSDEHDGRIAELEATLAEADKSAKEVEMAMGTYNKALARIKLQLDNLADNIESAEYFYRDDQGNLVPGVKAIEYDLSVTTDPERVRVLEEQLAAAKARMARFVDLYQEFSKTTGPRREKIEHHLAQLDAHLIALSHQRKMTEKQLKEYTANKKTAADAEPTKKPARRKKREDTEEVEEGFNLTFQEQLSLITALKTYLRDSYTELVAEVPPDGTQQLKNSIQRYKADPKGELVIVGKALEALGGGLSLQETELLYDRLSHADVNLFN